LSKRVDILNIGLILISFLLAYWLPVRLFLFSYAILGPLHYLTEIGWLDKRGYFSKRKKDVWILAALCGLLTLGFFLSQIDFIDPGGTLSTYPFIQSLISINEYAGAGIVFFAFCTAMVLVFVSRKMIKYGIIIVAAIIACFIHHIPSALLIFGVFIPTIIHVSIFTGIFMLYGALKSKSTWGYISVLLFFFGCISIFWIDMSADHITSTQSDFQMLLDSTFVHIGSHLSSFLGLKSPGEDYLLLSSLGLQIQMLFAFCYTYHYLNWFSKTKIINWHEVSRSYLIFTGVIWILSIFLYTINYKLGFLALFFLSMLHVFFEFPLNGVSFVGVIQEVNARIRK